MVRLLTENEIAGKVPQGTNIFNDLQQLADETPKFFSKYKLHEVKGWHRVFESVIGLQFIFIIPPNGPKVAKEPHVGRNWRRSENASSLTVDRSDSESLMGLKSLSDGFSEVSLVLDSDEFIVEVKGRASENVDYLFIRTNLGRYLELGNPEAKGEFSFRIPEGHGVMSLEIGIHEVLAFVAIQTLPISHLQLVGVLRPSVFADSLTPALIVSRTDFYGIDIRDQLFHDDFWAFEMQTHVKSRAIRLKKIKAVFQEMVYGLQLTYLVDSTPRTSSYNYKQAKARYSCAELMTFKLDETETLVGVSGNHDGLNGLTALQLSTSTGRVATFGNLLVDGNQFNFVTRGEVLAFSGIWDQDAVKALRVYYTE